MVVQGDTGSCDLVRSSWAERRQNRTSVVHDRLIYSLASTDGDPGCMNPAHRDITAVMV